jgi:hypothetical protein
MPDNMIMKAAIDGEKYEYPAASGGVSGGSDNFKITHFKGITLH